MESISNARAFGNLVRQRRKALGLRQKELALAVGVGERMIVDLEAGKETCQLGKALAIARAVGIRLVDADTELAGSPRDGYDLSHMDSDQ
jgi:y4mF family transcriptional regulator